MLKKLSLKYKIIIAFLSVGLIPLIATIIISSNIARSSLEEKAFEQLNSVQTIKKGQIENYFYERKHDVEVLSKSNDIKSASKNLLNYHEEMKIGTNDKFNISGDSRSLTKSYDEIYKEHIEFLNEYVRTYGYYDVFIVCSEHGHVMFTEARESDLGENLSYGRLRESGLAKVWEKVRKTKSVEIVDMDWYSPSDEPAMFIGAPVYNEAGEFTSVVALQISSKEINKIMQERTGMGSTGETYLVGSDKKMRSDSYLDPANRNLKSSFEGNIELNGVDTRASNEAINGVSNSEIIIDYNGNSVLSSYSPVQISKDLNWAIIAEIDEAEAFSSVYNLLYYVTIIAFVMIIIVVIWGYRVAAGIARPVIKIANKAKEISENEISNISRGFKALSKGKINENITSDTELLEKDREDEIGELTDSLNLMIKESQESVGEYENTRKNLESMISETGELIEAAKSGKLDSRGKSERYSGAYYDIIEGINEILNSFIEPINESAKVLDEMSKGNLTYRMKGNYDGDFEIIKVSINTLAESFSALLSEIILAIENLTNVSSEISSSSEEMAAGAEQQSEQVSEIATAIQEMAATVIQTANNASNASDSSIEAAKMADDGYDSVKQTINGMNSIAEVVENASGIIKKLGEGSKEIGEIINVINEIADQTNLLALNAAIEAARAGEQGRGFAVVADEVRKLAERTTNATKEISDMINSIQEDTDEAVTAMDKGTSEVKVGLSLADKAGKYLRDIRANSDGVKDLITQVATASEQQSSTSEEISANIENISSVTEQNSAGIQQIARAIENMTNHTEKLNDKVQFFKVDDIEKMEKERLLLERSN